MRSDGMADVTEKETPKAFISAKEMKEKYPKGEFRIVGEYVDIKLFPMMKALKS